MYSPRLKKRSDYPYMQIQPTQPISNFNWPQANRMVYPRLPKFVWPKPETLTKEIGKGNLIDLKA